jgi:hypothetical protein
MHSLLKFAYDTKFTHPTAKESLCLNRGSRQTENRQNTIFFFMKTLRKVTLWSIFSIAFFFTSLSSCKKESNSNANPTQLSHQDLDWTLQEMSFFSLSSRSQDLYRDKPFSQILYHPLLLQAHKKLIQENEERPFVEAIVNHSGLPAWSKSYVYCNPQTRDKLVIIPLTLESAGLVTGFISLYKKDDGSDTDFIINAMSRNELLDTTSGNPWQKAEYTKFMMKYDHFLYQKEDEKLMYSYCHYKSKTPNGPPPTNDPNPIFPPPLGCHETTPPSEHCEWRILEVCTDTESHNTWFGGTDGPLPSEIATWFDGDHDDDGTPDQEDEDYIDWYYEFTDWWELNFDIDIDWVDFFDGDHDDDGIIDSLDPDWDEFFINFEGMLDDLGKWFDGTWDDIDDWWDDFWDGEIGCPFDDPPLIGPAGDRTIECSWFYVLDCGSGTSGTNWYDTFEDVVPCPDCPGYLEYHEMYRDRLYSHWQSTYTGSMEDFWGLHNMSLSWGCNAYSPCFEECIDENVIENYFPSSEGLVPISFPEGLNNCFLGNTDCPNCTYSVTLFIDQPSPGERAVYSWTGEGSGPSSKNGGHTFLSINQYSPGNILPIRTCTFGFYPAGPVPSGNNTVAGSFYVENTNTIANISVTYPLTFEQLEEMKYQLSLVEPFYDVNDSNCSTIPAYILNSIGFNIPMTPRNVILLGTLNANPADLGEDLRASHPGGTFFSTSTPFQPPLSKCE